MINGYLQSMKSNIREIIRYIDDTTLEKSNDKKKDKQESASTISEEVQEFVNLTITEHMGKAYSEWKLNQDKEPVSEIDKSRSVRQFFHWKQNGQKKKLVFR